MNKNKYELFSCLWELTLKCNLNCMHCGSVAGFARQQELTLSECFHIAEEIVQLDCKELTFIGGEIFLYKGWEKIANYLSENGVIVNLMSNGYRIGNNEIDQIKFARLSNIGISLDGTEAVHNHIRGNKHSYSQIQKSFDILNLNAIPIGVVTSLMEINYPLLNDIYKLLIKNHVNLWQIQLVNPMGNMADKREQIIKHEHIPDLIEFIRDKNMDRYMLIVAGDNIGYYIDDSELYIRGNKNPLCFWSGCQAGISSLFIDSVGNVKGCGALYDARFIEGNLRRNSLEAIWKGKDNFSYNRKFKTSLLNGSCSDCDVNSVCQGGCRASNYFMTGSLYNNSFCSHTDVLVE